MAVSGEQVLMPLEDKQAPLTDEPTAALDPAAGPVGLPGAMIAWPAALALIESLRRDGALERRLDLAASLAEASPDGVRAFHRPVPLWRLAARLAVEALVMPIRVVLTAVRRA